jgi:hypothetical protein
MKNSSSDRAAPAVSIEVGDPTPTTAQEQEEGERGFEVFENQGIEGTYSTLEQTIGLSNIQSSR